MLMGMSEDQALHFDALALSMFHEFPCNLPFFTTLDEPLDQASRLENPEAPVLESLLPWDWVLGCATFRMVPITRST